MARLVTDIGMGIAHLVDISFLLQPFQHTLLSPVGQQPRRHLTPHVVAAVLRRGAQSCEACKCLFFSQFFLFSFHIRWDGVVGQNLHCGRNKFTLRYAYSRTAVQLNLHCGANFGAFKSFFDGLAPCGRCRTSPSSPAHRRSPGCGTGRPRRRHSGDWSRP